jgi:hypothetical protein
LARGQVGLTAVRKPKLGISLACLQSINLIDLNEIPDALRWTELIA